MNTTDYFTYVNAMFLFCIFTCGLLVWAVIRGFNIKRDANEDLKKAHDRIKQYDMDIADETRKYDALFKQHIERGKRIIALEVAKDNAEKESRDLRKQLTESEKQANGYKAEFIAASNELEATKAKVRKRDANGKFLPSGNGHVRTPKKLKLVTDLGENEVIHCPTLPEAEAICKLMDEAGLRWNSGDAYSNLPDWDKQEEVMCYHPKSGKYDCLEYFTTHNFTIHPASDFIARPKRVKKSPLKVSVDISSVEDDIQGVKDTLTFLGNDTDGTPVYKVEYKAAQPKLVHGLTVENPTEDEAKMIFDEAMRLGVDKLGIEIDDVKILDSTGKRMPHIWYSESKDYGRSISWRIAILQHSKNDERVVTAKEFVQRMQNGRM